MASPTAVISITHLSKLPLRDRAVRTIARWYVEEWGAQDADAEDAVAHAVADMEGDPAGDGLPSTWTAHIDSHLAGAAQLKRREVPALDAFEHWLGGVYVALAFRNRGVARRLVERCVEDAGQRGFDRLYLQTEVHNVGLYARLGWERAELPPGVVHQRPVMVRRLRA